MTNLGFHRLMAEQSVNVVTTPVGDRYVLEALSANAAYWAASSRDTSSGSGTT
jgi:phosphomannomutase